MSNLCEMAEFCEHCQAELEIGQIGLCDDCMSQDEEANDSPWLPVADAPKGVFVFGFDPALKFPLIMQRRVKGTGFNLQDGFGDEEPTLYQPIPNTDSAAWNKDIASAPKNKFFVGYDSLKDRPVRVIWNVHAGEFVSTVAGEHVVLTRWMELPILPR